MTIPTPVAADEANYVRPIIPNRPRLLDLCCCQGGATRGYQNAGFYVVGVDIAPQPRYVGDEFVQADALDVLRDRAFVSRFDAIHMSWPCQVFKLGTLRTTKPVPDLVTPGRKEANVTGIPWVIENVMEAPLDPARSIVLCANTFGLRTYRHRRFESSHHLKLAAPPHLPHMKRAPNRRRRERWLAGDHASITGDVGTYVGPEAMGIDWMTGNGLSEAIPPVYTRWVGAQLLAYLNGTRPASRRASKAA
ncbi:DNA cytosine methyltransferase [Micromonospora sp. NPDC051006]|uniref:DNA cytosine methyltransferase n=1 Tax=Micromonospora sp. NPDC051006 TaxID=3364283 RepID=UPI00379B1EE3